MREHLRLDRPLSGRELALAWAALAVVGALAFFPLIHHGGFHYDDWSNGAGTLYPPGGPGFGNTIDFFVDIALFRPGLLVYVPATYFVFGMDMTLHLAWSVALAVTVAALLYGVLRTFGVPWVHALMIGGLVVLFPWFDGTRYWVTGAQVSLSIAIVLGGLWVGLVGLARQRPRLHWVAAALYLASILTYEVTLPAVACFGVLYLLRAGWREARWRWGIDLGVVVIAAVWNAMHTERTTSGIEGNIDHLGEIIEGGAAILGRALLPVGPEHTTLALVALAVVFGLGALALYGRPRWFTSETWGLRGWLLLALAGFLVACVGWVIFVPADPYYTPTIYGLTNRVNGLAGIGVVMLVYAALGVVGTIVGALWREVGLRPVVITAALALLLGAGYASVIKRHTGIWNSAYESEEQALSAIQARYSQLPPGSTLYVSGHPVYQTLGVPILSSTWDFDGMIKTRYEDGSLTGLPVLEGSRLVCGPDSLDLDLEGEIVGSAPYGAARLFDIPTGRSARPLDRGECEGEIGRYRPGPLYLSTDY